mmetsp:Transcript_56259/g.125548  ORF Transcript_56259/g.125548 Transcript_56259/m.125548 type:complete len:185 (-) Transcript_56259:101-655(-)
MPPAIKTPIDDPVASAAAAGDLDLIKKFILQDGIDIAGKPDILHSALALLRLVLTELRVRVLGALAIAMCLGPQWGRRRVARCAASFSSTLMCLPGTAHTALWIAFHRNTNPRDHILYENAVRNLLLFAEIASLFCRPGRARWNAVMKCKGDSYSSLRVTFSSLFLNTLLEVSFVRGKCSGRLS